jgi:hypothetical protein
LVTKLIREKAVNLEIMDESTTLPLIEDQGASADAAWVVQQELEEAFAKLSPLALVITAMLIDPPEYLQAEFDAVEAKRELIKQANLDERYPAELNLAFISSLLSSMGVGKTMLASAKNEVRDLESSYEV